MGPGFFLGAGLGMIDQSLAKGARSSLARYTEYLRNVAAEKEKEFAKNQVQWRVEDAQAAGIHPLAALGMVPMSAPPTVVGEGPPSDGRGDVVGAMGAVGQEALRSIATTMSPEERQLVAINLMSAKLDVEGKSIDNAIRASQLQKMLSAPPGFTQDNFMDGQGNSGLRVQPKAATPVVSEPGRPSQEAGWSPDRTMGNTGKGLTPIIPQAQSESYESDTVGGWEWQFRNRILPLLGSKDTMPPKSQWPKGAIDMEYEFGYGWVPVFQRKKRYPFRGR